MHSHHSHSGQFCKHAVGQLEEVVKRAIERGFFVYGLTEHVPRYRAQDLYPEEKDLSLEELEDTFRGFMVEARRLQAVYANQIQLLVGLETEHITSSDISHLKNLVEVVGGVDYIVGSVHHVCEIPIDFDRTTFDRAASTIGGTGGVLPTDIDACHAMLCIKYLDAQHELLEQLQPTVVGHFDLCRLYRPGFALDQHPEVWRRVERNVALAISYGALFEVNSAAFRKGWSTAYPGTEVAKLIIQHGGRFVLSDDSHGPDAVGLNYTRLRGYLQTLGVRELWYLVRQVDGVVIPTKVDGIWWEHPFWSGRLPSSD
ncbi:histidinol-phosphatase [Auriculariales sp. MPI-PUGE-AT-0066]|nr:histidinol-phosphatase [Auriculariales sp. MPI-PUGE-AT-0066]